MPEAHRRRLPLQFSVLYRQFLFNMVDLESLSIHADTTRYLGQFGGVLLFVSLLLALGALWPSGHGLAPEPMRTQHAWLIEQFLLSTNFLVTGLVALLTWDSNFPDRRDVLVLSPLPIRPHTILLARIAASASVVGIAVLALNCTSVIAWAIVLVPTSDTFRLAVALWIGVIASSAFVYCAVLTIQGCGALLLPRRMFLRFSAAVQIAAFGLVLGSYFLEPYLNNTAALTAPANHIMLALSPSFWFFALANQANGTLPPQLAWLARIGWSALAIVVAGALSSLALSYLRTMRKTIEQPDLLPTRRTITWPSLGDSLHAAIFQFVWRALARSRHHRVILAFYLSIVLSLALGIVRSLPPAGSTAPFTAAIPMPSVLMMGIAILGFRSVFAIPVSLNANWVLRTTQLRPSQDYIAASRGTLLLLSVLPVCALSLLLSLRFRPWPHVLVHVAVLALLGTLLVDLTLIGFSKVPFTCSYMPDKSNFPLVFWSCFAALILLMIFVMSVELPALDSGIDSSVLIAVLALLAAGVWRYNRQNSRSAVIYFDEKPDELITTLGIVGPNVAQAGSLE